jgi:photosystem II stability/assembly factor-like uncharacterized protein
MNTTAIYTAFVAVFLCAATAVGSAQVPVPDTRFPEVEMLDMAADGDNLYIVGLEYVYISHDAGKNWVVSARVVDETGGMPAIIKVGSRLFVSTFTKGVFESTDDGYTWQSRSQGLGIGGTSVVLTFAVRGDRLFAGTAGGGVYMYELDGSKPWIPFNANLPWNLAWNINTLFADGKQLYAGAGLNSVLYINSPETNTWRDVQFGDMISTGLGMVGFARRGNVLLGGASNGLYRSTDDGETWSYFDAGLINVDRVRFTEHNGILYAGLMKTSGMRLFSSIDTGATWQLVGHYLNIMPTHIEAVGDRLYIPTIYGLYYLPLGTSDVDEPAVPTTLRVHLFPNPVFNQATLEYSLEASTHVELNIYDLAHRHVATVVDEQQSEGTHRVKMDVTDLSSGVYFLHLATGDRTTVRQFHVVR